MRTFLVFVGICLLVAVGVAFYLNWLDIQTKRNAEQNKTEVTLSVDRDKFKEDVKTAKEKASETAKDIGKGVQDLLGNHKLEGTLEQIDTEKERLTVKSKDGKDSLDVRLEPSTKIRIGDKDGVMGDLKPGDHVTVVYETKDGTHIAKTVTVMAKS